MKEASFVSEVDNIFLNMWIHHSLQICHDKNRRVLFYFEKYFLYLQKLFTSKENKSQKGIYNYIIFLKTRSTAIKSEKPLESNILASLINKNPFASSCMHTSSPQKEKGRQRANLILKNIFASKLPKNKQSINSQAVPNTDERRMDHKSKGTQQHRMPTKTPLKNSG
jgi:hypothetical protein